MREPEGSLKSPIHEVGLMERVKTTRKKLGRSNLSNQERIIVKSIVGVEGLGEESGGANYKDKGRQNR